VRIEAHARLARGPRGRRLGLLLLLLAVGALQRRPLLWRQLPGGRLLQLLVLLAHQAGHVEAGQRLLRLLLLRLVPLLASGERGREGRGRPALVAPEDLGRRRRVEGEEGGRARRRRRRRPEEGGRGGRRLLLVLHDVVALAALLRVLLRRRLAARLQHLDGQHGHWLRLLLLLLAGARAEVGGAGRQVAQVLLESGLRSRLPGCVCGRRLCWAGRLLLAASQQRRPQRYHGRPARRLLLLQRRLLRALLGRRQEARVGAGPLRARRRLAANLEYHLHVVLSAGTEAALRVPLVAEEGRDEVVVLAGLELEPVRLRREGAKGDRDWGPRFTLLLVAHCDHAAAAASQPASVVLLLRYLWSFVWPWELVSN